MIESRPLFRRRTLQRRLSKRLWNGYHTPPRHTPYRDHKQPAAVWKRIRRFLKILVLVAVAAFIVYQLWVVACLAWWETHSPAETAFMEERLDKLREKDADARLKHRWVSYARISPHLKRAVIAAEDAKFTQHDGFDWEAMQSAFERNWRRGRIVSGGSTISQQLAKNLFLSGKRNVWRKAEEAYITAVMEQMMDKRRILEIYLNVIEWGNGVFGAEAAARHYFGVSAAALNPQQAAHLAAMIPNPRYYDRHRQTRYVQNRSGVILARMPAVSIPK